MKKMLLALVAIFAMATISEVSAYNRPFNRGFRTAGCNTCATNTCAPACPTVPKCFKTIEVPALEKRIKQAPVCERIPQPDKVVWHAQPDIVVYECPSDCN